MRWVGRRQSANIEDRRGQRAGPGRMAMGGGMSIGGLVLLLVVAAVFGVNPLDLLGPGQPGAPQGVQQGGQAVDPQEQPLRDFVAVVLADTEDVWNAQFQQMNAAYREPTLVLYSGSVNSACGFASAAVGPFYCPGDEKVYIDLSFYRDLQTRYGAPGDFAMAYVIAHEVGHHVQHQLGFSDQVDDARRGMNERHSQQLSVRLELQADYLAGVYAHHAQRTKDILEQGDIEEAMQAAEAVGDDKLQREQQGYVRPDSFTHGTSAQRKRWFMKGYETGDLRQAQDAFAIRYEEL